MDPFRPSWFERARAYCRALRATQAVLRQESKQARSHASDLQLRARKICEESRRMIAEAKKRR